MGHAPALLKKIADLLRDEYPPSECKYIFEQQIRGTRMMPDILVKAGDDKILCVVEIGYTRPEKLTAYRRELKIPDVRWYDKSGNLHADVEERVISLKVECTPGTMYAYDLAHQIACYACCEEDEEEFCHVDVHTLLITDYVTAYFPSICDKCGATWFAHDECDAHMLMEELGDTNKFGLEYGARTPISWGDAVARVENQFGLKLEYGFGGFLNNSDFTRALFRVSRQERRA